MRGRARTRGINMKAFTILFVLIFSVGVYAQTPVVFTKDAGVNVSANTLTKTGTEGWNAGASSTQSIASGDGYVEFTVAELKTAMMIGLSRGDSNQNYLEIDFALYVTNTGHFVVSENGTPRGTFGKVKVGDVPRVAVEGGIVKYRNNQTLLYTSTVAPSYPLLVDTSLRTPGARLKDVVILSGAIPNPTPALTPASTPVPVPVPKPTPIISNAIPKSAAEKQADELIGKYVQARGGMNKLKAINTLRLTGKRNLGPGFEAAFTMEMARPDKSRMEFVIQGMTGIQTYDGNNGWVVNPFLGKTAPEPVTASELESLRWQSDFDGALIDYEAKGYRVEFAGQEDVEGTPAYKLKLTRKNGEISFFYLDTEMHQLFMESHKTTINGQVIESETNYGDYKAVGGVLFAHSITTRAKHLPAPGQLTSIEKIEVNPNLPATRFGKP
jgi:hypothetical protein